MVYAIWAQENPCIHKCLSERQHHWTRLMLMTRKAFSLLLTSKSPAARSCQIEYETDVKRHVSEFLFLAPWPSHRSGHDTRKTMDDVQIFTGELAPCGFVFCLYFWSARPMVLTSERKRRWIYLKKLSISCFDRPKESCARGIGEDIFITLSTRKCYPVTVNRSAKQLSFICPISLIALCTLWVTQSASSKENIMPTIITCAQISFWREEMKSFMLISSWFPLIFRFPQSLNSSALHVQLDPCCLQYQFQHFESMCPESIVTMNSHDERFLFIIEFYFCLELSEESTDTSARVLVPSPARIRPRPSGGCERLSWPYLTKDHVTGRIREFRVALVSLFVVCASLGTRKTAEHDEGNVGKTIKLIMKVNIRKWKSTFVPSCSRVRLQLLHFHAVFKTWSKF